MHECLLCNQALDAKRVVRLRACNAAADRGYALCDQSSRSRRTVKLRESAMHAEIKPPVELVLFCLCNNCVHQ